MNNYILSKTCKNPKLAAKCGRCLDQDCSNFQQSQNGKEEIQRFTSKGKALNNFLCNCLIQEKIISALVLTFTQDEQWAKCAGSCSRSNLTRFDRPLWHENHKMKWNLW